MLDKEKPIWERGKPFDASHIEAISAVLAVTPHIDGLRSLWTIQTHPGIHTSLEFLLLDPPLAFIRYSIGSRQQQPRIIDPMNRIETQRINDIGILAITYGDRKWQTVIELSSTGAFRETLGYFPIRLPNEAPQGMTTQEAETYLGVGPTTVKYLIRRGRLPANKIGGQWSIDPESVRSYQPNRKRQ